MPPRGVKKGTKRARQYEHIKESQKEQGRSEDARRGDRRAHGQQGDAPAPASRGRARAPRRTTCPRRGAAASARAPNRQKGRTRDQLYNEAKNLSIEGRS